MSDKCLAIQMKSSDMGSSLFCQTNENAGGIFAKMVGQIVLLRMEKKF